MSNPKIGQFLKLNDGHLLSLLKLRHILLTQAPIITKQAGVGPLAFEVPPDIEAAIVGKAVSLLATSVSAHLAKKGVFPPKILLSRCMPSEVRPLAERSRRNHLSSFAFIR